MTHLISKRKYVTTRFPTCDLADSYNVLHFNGRVKFKRMEERLEPSGFSHSASCYCSSKSLPKLVQQIKLFLGCSLEEMVSSLLFFPILKNLKCNGTIFYFGNTKSSESHLRLSFRCRKCVKRGVFESKPSELIF
jgi:hypothetical protein